MPNVLLQPTYEQCLWLTLGKYDLNSVACNKCFHSDNLQILMSNKVFNNKHLNCTGPPYTNDWEKREVFYIHPPASSTARTKLRGGNLKAERNRPNASADGQFIVISLSLSLMNVSNTSVSLHWLFDSTWGPLQLLVARCTSARTDIRRCFPQCSVYTI